MEVLLNDGQHFGTEDEKLDKISTFGVLGDFSAPRTVRAAPKASPGSERGTGTFFGGSSYTQLDILFQT